MNLSLHSCIARADICAKDRATMLFLNECRAHVARLAVRLSTSVQFSPLYSTRQLRQFY